MKQLFQNMRNILENAPPLAFHAAAVFLSHEQPRWAQLAENTDLLEERFYRFLTAPASWDLVLEHLNEAREDWKETRCELCKGQPAAIGSCRSCDGKGWFWLNQKTGEKDMEYGNPVKYGRVNEEGEGGAPANAAGNAGVAGIGQPPGSAFGEPGFALGGATTKTKKKNKRPEDLKESRTTRMGIPVKCAVCGQTKKPVGRSAPMGWSSCDDECKGYRQPPYPGSLWPGETEDDFGYPIGDAGTKRVPVKDEVDESAADWFHGISLSNSEIQHVLANAKAALQVYPPNLIPQLRKLYAAAVIGSRPNPTAVVQLRQFLRDNGVLEAVSDKDVEIAAKAVHDRWVKNQKKAGETEHKSPDGKEDYMVPYDKLSDKSKEMDREAVRATLDTLKIDEDTKAYKGYLIQVDYLGRVTIKKDGQHIATAKSEDDAKAQIDMLTEDTFAGAPVFDVSMDKWMASRFGKKRYHRYSRYVGNDELGETIRKHGRSTKDDIVLKDSTTGAMTYLRRKAPRTT